MTNRLIALGDILGFKHTVLTTPLQEILTNHFGYFRRALTHTLGDLQGLTDVTDIASLKQRTGLGFEWFSDSIVLYTKDDAPASKTALVATANWLVFEAIFHAGVRLRFGIDFGELHVDENAGHLLGSALVGAHELERQQRWTGGAFTPRAAAQLPAEARHYLADYEVPVKDSSFATRAALNWTLGVHYNLKLDYSRSKPEPTAEDREAHRDIVDKWENTRAFHRTLCTACAPRR
jgi:hypothetical protein